MILSACLIWAWIWLLSEGKEGGWEGGSLLEFILSVFLFWMPWGLLIFTFG